MEIIEYNRKYENDAKDLLTELEEYIVSIDEDNLDRVGEDYHEKMLEVDLEEIDRFNGKCFLAIEDDKAVGLIMACIREWEASDYLDFKCPKTGKITELIVTKNTRSSGIGTKLIEKAEDYLISERCQYITIEVFAYNDNAITFYNKHGYHNRMYTMIKKVEV